MTIGRLAKGALKVVGGLTLLGGLIWAFKDAPDDGESSENNSDSWDDYYYYNQWLWDDDYNDYDDDDYE